MSPGACTRNLCMGDPPLLTSHHTTHPQVRTKLSDVDPGILNDINDEFDRIDAYGSGRMGVSGVVELFGSLGQPISVEDASVLVRKLNAQRPASAGSAGSGDSGSEGREGMGALQRGSGICEASLCLFPWRCPEHACAGGLTVHSLDSSMLTDHHPPCLHRQRWRAVHHQGGHHRGIHPPHKQRPRGQARGPRQRPPGTLLPQPVCAAGPARVCSGEQSRPARGAGGACVLAQRPVQKHLWA